MVGVVGVEYRGGDSADEFTRRRGVCLLLVIDGVRKTVVRNGWSFDQKSAFMREKNGITPPPVGEFVTERHYTAHEVANILSLSDDKVRRLFQDEPGVLVIGDQGSRHKRRYTTLRIPESVLHRVMRRMRNV